MNKYGEPWEVSSGSERVFIMDKTREPIDTKKMHRATLCVNACAGISDEEVQGLINDGGLDKIWDKNEEEHNTLKSKLAEARALLKLIDEILVTDHTTMHHEWIVDKLRCYLKEG